LLHLKIAPTDIRKAVMPPDCVEQLMAFVGKSGDQTLMISRITDEGVIACLPT
jgi:hypothetical protein